MTDHNSPTRVVVLGGGYAGTLAANHLRMRTDVDITVVNPRPRFVEWRTGGRRPGQPVYAPQAATNP